MKGGQKHFVPGIKQIGYTKLGYKPEKYWPEYQKKKKKKPKILFF